MTEPNAVHSLAITDRDFPQMLKNFEQSLKQLKNIMETNPEFASNLSLLAQNSAQDSDQFNGSDQEENDGLIDEEGGDATEEEEEEERVDKVDDEMAESGSDESVVDQEIEQMVDTAFSRSSRLQQLLQMNELYKSANHLFDPTLALSVMAELSPDLRLLSCADCDFTTQDSDELTAHQKSHLLDRHRAAVSTAFQRLSKDLFKCPECEEWFTTDKKLTDHQSKAHNKVVLQCIKCPFSTKETKLFARHAEQHSNRRFVCPVLECMAIFEDLDQLREHSTDVHNRINCDNCDKSFKMMSSLFEHNKRAHSTSEDSLLECPVCGHKYNCRTRYEKHVKSHDVSNRLQCPDCDLTFEKEVALEVHVNRDHKNCQPFVCEICAQQFYANEKLLNHLSNKHKIAVYICEKCDYKTNSKYKMERHRVVHNPDRYKCDQRGCYLIFETKYNLTIHKKIKHLIDDTEDDDSAGNNQHSIGSHSDGNSNESMEMNGNQTKSSYDDNSDHTRDFFSVSDFLQIDLKDGDYEDMAEASDESADGQGRDEKSILEKVLQKSGKSLTITQTNGNEEDVEEGSDEDDEQVFGHRFCSVDGCQKVVMSGQELRDHMLTIHKLIKCNKCEKCFQSFSGLYKHKRRYHTSQRQIVCRFCDKKFFYQTSYEKHIETHQKPNDPQSRGSGLVISGGQTLLNKPVLKIYSCHDCNQEFAEKHNYLKHLSTMHSSFKSKESLQKYRRTERQTAEQTQQMPDNGINCLISGCDKTFGSNAQLNKHMRVKHDITLEPIPSSETTTNADDQTSSDSSMTRERQTADKRMDTNLNPSQTSYGVKQEPTDESCDDFDSNFTLFTEFLAKTYGMVVTETTERSDQSHNKSSNTFDNLNQNLLCFECNKGFGSYDLLYRHNNEFHNKYRPKYK